MTTRPTTPTPGPAPTPDPPDMPDMPDSPVIRIERGNPTPAQLAALTTVLATATATGTGQPPQAPRRTLWTTRSRFARPRPAVGPDGWRASALPR